MSKKKNKIQTISVMSGVEATVMPKFNTHAVGHGKWTSRKDKQRRSENDLILLQNVFIVVIKLTKGLIRC